MSKNKINTKYIKVEIEPRGNHCNWCPMFDDGDDSCLVFGEYLKEDPNDTELLLRLQMCIDAEI